MTPVTALGLSFPSCPVRFLEYPVPWCFEVAMLPGSGMGARRACQAAPWPALPRVQDHLSWLVTCPPILSHTGSLLISQIHMDYPIFQKVDEVLRRRERHIQGHLVLPLFFPFPAWRVDPWVPVLTAWQDARGSPRGQVPTLTFLWPHRLLPRSCRTTRSSHSVWRAGGWIRR